MRKVAVFFEAPGAKDYPLNKEEYWIAYQELAEEVRALGGKFFMVRSNHTYGGKGHFSASWQFENGELVERGPVTLDVVYDKGKRFHHDHTIPVLNTDFINDICTDKWKTYELFKEFCPLTFRVETEPEFEEALQKIPTQNIVIKPLDGEEGQGVFIGPTDYIQKCPRKFPLLVQEFLDSSEGIPGVCEGIHDLRVIMMDDAVVFSFVRTAPEGKLLSNVAQGGNLVTLEKSQIPKAVLELVHHIDGIISKEAPHYCFGVDVAFVQGEPKIIELNSRVGLQENARHAHYQEFKQKLAHLLVHGYQS